MPFVVLIVSICRKSVVLKSCTDLRKFNGGQVQDGVAEAVEMMLLMPCLCKYNSVSSLVL
jgi:hypothetical protein